MTFPGLIDDKQALAEDVPTSVCFAQNAAKLRHQLADSAIRVGVHHSALAEVQSLHERRGLCQVNGVRRMGINQMGYLIRAISQRHPDSRAPGQACSRWRPGRQWRFRCHWQVFFSWPYARQRNGISEACLFRNKVLFLWPHNLKIWRTEFGKNSCLGCFNISCPCNFSERSLLETCKGINRTLATGNLSRDVCPHGPKRDISYSSIL